MDEASAMAAINAGSLEAIFTNEPGRAQQPIVQCLQIRPMQNNSSEGTERFRVVFGDTRNYVQSMLATHLNAEIHSDRLKKGGIVQLMSYQANYVKGKRSVKSRVESDHTNLQQNTYNYWHASARAIWSSPKSGQFNCYGRQRRASEY